MGSLSPPEPERKRVRFTGNGTDNPMDTDKLEKSTLQAIEVVQLRFIRSASDIDPAGAAGPHPPALTTHPGYLHQIFPKGVVYGWRSLCVAVYVHLPTLTYWIDSSGEFREMSDDKEAVEVTDVPTLIAPFVKGGLVTSREEFENVIERAGVMAISNKVGGYEKDGRRFAIYEQGFFAQREDGVSVKDDAFHDLHLRMTFLMFVHIDGASFINDEDPRWEVYVIAEELDGKPTAFVGYATIYVFSSLKKRDGEVMQFADRVRISQFIISPLEQGRGHGSKLLNAVYTGAYSRTAIEVTVEDPSLGFRVLRDVTDLKRTYLKGFLQTDAAVAEEERDDVVNTLRNEMLLTAGQAKRCLEVHQLRLVNRAYAEQYKKYRLWVKRRLFKENYEILDNYDKEERKQKLSEIYEDLEKEYLEAIVRLNTRKQVLS